MTADFKMNLEKYAEIIVKKGLNIQRGQRLLIGMPFHWIPGTPIELAPLVRLVTAQAYKADARFVEVMWNGVSGFNEVYTGKSGDCPVFPIITVCPAGN